MRIIFILAVTLTLHIPVSSSDVADGFIVERDDKLVSESLTNLLREADSRIPIKAWIFFTDKGFSTLPEYDDKLTEAQNRLTERARARRLKARGFYNLVDYRDIPVFNEYIADIKSTGAKVRNVLRWFNAVTVEADIDQLNRIAKFSFIRIFKSISTADHSDRFIRQKNSSGSYLILNTTLDYGLSLSQLEQQNNIVAHELDFAGQGILICLMDTGFLQDHVSFENLINQDRLIAQWDFVNNDGDTDHDESQDVFYQAWHGTMAWSTIAGEVSGNLYGAAYGALYCLAKTESVEDELHSEEDNWAAGAEWADSLGADIISSSLGYRYAFDPPDTDYTYENMNGDATIVTQAADLAVYNGITVLTAMGNSGSFGAGSMIAPADGDSVISVGAVDSFGVITDFSSLGPTFDGRIKPEICARGQDVLCALTADMNDFTFSNGTSLSTPLSAGAAAVLLSIHSNWTPMMVREALMMTATRPDTPSNAYGWGIIDVGKALYYHPEGDIIIDHEPLVYFPGGQIDQTISAEISGGNGIDPSSVFSHWRTDDSQPFTQTAMTSSDNIHFEGVIPGQNSGTVHYYISADDNSGLNAVYPFAAPENYFSVAVSSTMFIDSFENGRYYWNTTGTAGQWAINAEHAATGNISITDSPARFYNNDAEILLTGNFSISLADCDSATVGFKARFDLQADRDFIYLETSIDDGQSWQQIGSPITGNRPSFMEYAYDLSEYLGHDVKFRFRMTTDNQTVREGIFIDDFTVIWHSHTSITDGATSMPSWFELGQNYPNPFNASTTIKYILAEQSLVTIEIYDILGRKLETINRGQQPTGEHQLIWHSKDQPSGVYFFKLQAGDFSETKRMLLLK
ncbi:MAG: S8 family serine peptidase [candidate division Zixibacteria bacterium]|nr:S8 family serine peptidase [candidate division Zixibacteria bacterium]